MTRSKSIKLINTLGMNEKNIAQKGNKFVLLCAVGVSWMYAYYFLLGISIQITFPKSFISWLFFV